MMMFVCLFFIISTSLLLNDLNDIFILQHVVLTHPLRVELYGRTPHHSALEAIQNTFVNPIAEVLHSAFVTLQNDRRTVIRNLSLRFCVTIKKLILILILNIFNEINIKYVNIYILTRSRSFQICSISSSKFHSR